MAAACSHCLLLTLLPLLVVCSSGTLVGYSFNAQRELTTSSEVRTVTFCRLNEVSSCGIPVSGSSAHLFLSGSVVENLISAGPSGVSLLKSNIIISVHQLSFDGIVLDFGNRNGNIYELYRILSSVKSVHKLLGSTRLEHEHNIKLSVVFSLAFLGKLGKEYERDQLHSLFNSFKNVMYLAVVEENNVRIESGMGDASALSLAERAIVTGLVVPPDKFALTVLIRSPKPPSVSEVAEFTGIVSKYLRKISDSRICVVELHVKESGMELYRRRDRKLLDATVTPTLPTTPIPVITPDTPTPIIVTVPGTAPATVTPTIPPNTATTIPSATPVTYPPPIPTNPPAPITIPAATPIGVPGAGTQPVTNPVTTYPSPPGSAVPVTAPVANPVPPTATTNVPAVPGQSWCIARTGVTDAALQAALDYACGIGGADCSQIQQGASCYIPNTLQNHASYAFNSYYQRNPASTSCDFGGTAVIVNSNPSVGSCSYPNTASVAAPATVATPAASSSPTPTTAAPLTSSGNPPAVVNPVTGAPSGFTTESPLALNSSTSRSATLVPGCHIIILASLMAAKLMAVDR